LRILLKPVVDFPLENLILAESMQFRSSQLTRSGGTMRKNPPSFSSSSLGYAEEGKSPFRTSPIFTLDAFRNSIQKMPSKTTTKPRLVMSNCALS
jgi:hypothetical protein